eukprot:UN29436
MVLLNFKSRELLGQTVQDALADTNITSNKNPVPFDSPRPSEWVGLRLGVAAATTRGLDVAEFEVLGNAIADVVDAIGTDDEAVLARTRRTVADLCQVCPVYEH